MALFAISLLSKNGESVLRKKDKASLTSDSRSLKMNKISRLSNKRTDYQVSSLLTYEYKELQCRAAGVLITQGREALKF